jgi:hypothetical protein
MRREERPSEGWYYRHDGQAFGPVASAQLRDLLAAGRLRPRQAVWQRGGHGLLFVQAAMAASATREKGPPPSPSEPIPPIMPSCSWRRSN